MNWSKAVIAGVVGGVVNLFYSFVMHGVIMESTYKKYTPTIFREGVGMTWFLIIPILLGIAGGLAFAKSRASWGTGVKGGATFGFWIGLIGFLANFYTPLIYNNYPYYLTWCTGGILLIGWVVTGAAIAAMYKS